MRRLLFLLLLIGSALGLGGCVVAPAYPGYHGPPRAAYHAPVPAYGSGYGHRAQY